MENFMIYLLKSGIWIAVFWSLYRFFFREETFFVFNRFFLLSGLALSFVLALCRYRYPVTVHLLPTALPGNDFAQGGVTSGVTANLPLIIAGIYLAGVFVLLLYHLNGLNRIRNMIQRRKAPFRSHPPVIEVAGICSSFSFFKYIFMDKSTNLSEAEKRLIIEHETAHVEQRHWMDLSFAQTVCLLQWFNPFAWLYLRAIRENHEFLADRSVLRKGNSPAVYHATLINYAFKAPVFTLTNSFAYYNKFKRITMMKKKTSKSTKKFAALLLLPAFAIFLSAFAEPEYRVSVPTEQDKIAVHDSIVKDGIIFPDKMLGNVTYYVDEKEVSSIDGMNPEDIHSISVYRDKDAVKRYGKNSVVSIITKKRAEETGIKNEKTFETGRQLKSAGKKAVAKNEKKSAGDVVVHEPSDPPAIGNKNEDAAPSGKSDGKVTVKSLSTEKIWGIDNIKDGEAPLIIIDGKEYDCDILKVLDTAKIESISILKENGSTIALYGEKGKNGVIIIKTKDTSEETEKQDIHP
ncbi:MAG: M56 family metallopeptidase [Tannerella sp.]|jgi:TonB-dependent SusC/RagA subfamily outer membrane receptor|nr:M56 family metallopeptidase [Tannerella sp.]